jgi:hypothetical protein
MATTQQQPQSGLERFTGLRWYSASVTFLFSFLAITSEPLLAAGIVLSAIDFLQRGQLLAHNPVLASAWSIAQGLAMEVSVGPVLKNTLEARSEKDQVKTWLYGVLAGFLFAVGGAMLFLQFTESIMGISESALPIIILISLFAARTIASLGYIALACTKHVRFSGTPPLPSSETPAPDVKQQSGISDETMALILAKLAKVDELEQRVAAAPVMITEAHETPVALLGTGETGSEPAQDESEEDVPEPALDAQLAALLAINQNVTSRDAALIVGRPHSTVYRAMKRLEQPVKQSSVE